jgi:hypothetical protein
VNRAWKKRSTPNKKLNNQDGFPIKNVGNDYGEADGNATGFTKPVPFLMADGCRQALEMDAPIIRRALSEPFDVAQDRLRELARFSLSCVHLI